MKNPYIRAIEKVEENWSRENNVIPYGFDNVSYYLPGTEKQTFSIITASSGVAKSQFTDFIAVHKPMEMFWELHKKSQSQTSPFKVKILYWSLEMAAEIKGLQLLSHHIFQSNGGYNNPFNAPRYGLKTMLSIYNDKRLTTVQKEELKAYSEYFEWFYDHVEIITGRTSPYGVYTTLYEYFNNEKIGKIHYKTVTSNHYNPDTNQTEQIEKEVFDYYEYNLENKNLFVIVVIDHASLISANKFTDLRLAMEKLSMHLLEIRNMFGPSIYMIQQQASNQESKDNFMRPTLSGLGDNKAVQRDVDYVIGLFDPVRANEKYCLGFDMKRMNPRYREGSILKSRYGVSNIRWSMFYDGTTESFWQLPSEEHCKKSEYNQIIESWYRLAESLPIVM